MLRTVTFHRWRGDRRLGRRAFIFNNRSHYNFERCGQRGVRHIMELIKFGLICKSRLCRSPLGSVYSVEHDQLIRAWDATKNVTFNWAVPCWVDICQSMTLRAVHVFTPHPPLSRSFCTLPAHSPTPLSLFVSLPQSVRLLLPFGRFIHPSALSAKTLTKQLFSAHTYSIISLIKCNNM